MVTGGPRLGPSIQVRVLTSPLGFKFGLILLVKGQRERCPFALFAQHFILNNILIIFAITK